MKCIVNSKQLFIIEKLGLKVVINLSWIQNNWELIWFDAIWIDWIEFAQVILNSIQLFIKIEIGLYAMMNFKINSYTYYAKSKDISIDRYINEVTYTKE